MPFFSTVAKVRRDDTGALTDIPVLISEEGPLTPLIHYLLWRSHDRSLSWMRKVTLAVQRFLLYMVSILINSATDSRDKTAKYSHAQAATDSHPKPAT